MNSFAEIKRLCRRACSGPNGLTAAGHWLKVAAVARMVEQLPVDDPAAVVRHQWRALARKSTAACHLERMGKHGHVYRDTTERTRLLVITRTCAVATLKNEQVPWNRLIHVSSDTLSQTRYAAAPILRPQIFYIPRSRLHCCKQRIPRVKPGTK